MIEDGRDRVSKKKQQIEDHSRFLKEKHEEMHYFAQMRRLEHEDNRERMLNDWTITHMRKCDSVDQRLFQKKLKIKQLILESQQGRDLAQKKLSKFRESRANLQELNKINFEIENIVKQRIVDRHRNEEINRRVEKAKLVGNAKANRPTIGNSSNLVSKNITLNDINTSR